MPSWKLQIAFSFLLLTSCGAIPGSTDSNGDNGEVSSSSNRTLALDSKDDLPECSDGNVNQLVYVKDEKQFYECDGEWTAIDVGPEQLDDNHFLDKVTGYVWQKGGIIYWQAAQKACTGEWSVPTAAEGYVAWAHGLNPDDGFWINEKATDGYGYYVKNASSKTKDTSAHPNSPISVCVRK